jgi:hypothetical protein
MQKFIVIEKSGFWRKLFVIKLLLPFWLLMVYSLYYLKSHPEIKSIYTLTLFLFGLVLLVILSDNLHKIVARKTKITFSEKSLFLLSFHSTEINYEDIISISFDVQRYDNKLWMRIVLKNSQIMNFQIIDNWYKTPFLMNETKRNFKRILTELSENQSLQQIVDNSSVLLLKENLRLSI